tara:strand:- start:8531 stop:9151 length:621 start_codon:yes stop_codon:yes gene_type:complete
MRFNNMKNFLITILFIFANASFAFIEIDSLAPDFELTDTFGKKVSLDSFKGKKVVLEWTNHGCPFVAKHYKTKNMQSTQELAKSEAAIWLSIISSAPGTQGYVTKEEANELTASRNASPAHVLLDPTGKVGMLYSAKTTPQMYVIDEEGYLKYQGAIDDAGGRGFMFKDLLQAKNYVKNALKELSQGQKIVDPITKPYGCSVKYAG